MKRRLALLGCTGSIGSSSQIVADSGDFSVTLLANGNDLDGLKALIKKYTPETAVCVGKKYLYHKGKEYVLPDDYLSRTEAYENADIVVNGIVGLSGLTPTLTALKAGKKVATANKESFVCAGTIVNQVLSQSTGDIYPVDSEHSAAWQLLQSNKNTEKIIITASGGAFRDLSKEQLRHAKAVDALKHPTWKMGKKVTIDCATLVNKGMELIEAKHLFHLPTEAIGHRESIIHAMVKNKDGSVVANMSMPTMVAPISYALHYPEGGENLSQNVDFEKIGAFTFFTLDEERFPALSIAKEAVKMGDIAGCVFHAADETLVKRYLSDDISFYDISDGIKKAFDKFTTNGDFDSVELVFRMEKAVKEYTSTMTFGGCI